MIIGNTPLVKLSDKLYGKLEALNPGGSIKDRPVKYILDSYYEGDHLYTKVMSFYGHHKIISVISHEICKSTVEANRWTLRAFTLKTASFKDLARRQRIPMLLQLHF